jgi:hypothetical protein
MLKASNKAAAAAQLAADQTLRHFIIEQALILNTAIPPASSSDSDVVTEAETDDLYYTESVGFVSDFVSGEAPKDKKSEWEILGERTDKNIKPTVVLNKSEEMTAMEIIGQVKQQHQKEKTIVIQPFGRSSSLGGGGVVFDGSSRSMEQSTFMELVAELSKDYNIMYMGEHRLNVVNLPIFQPDNNMPLRIWAAIIEAADYFIGCDSVGQHLAYAFDKPGTIVCGSTFPVNITYPDHFNIVEKKNAVRHYSPIRIAGFASEEADRLNDTIMDFSKEELKSIIAGIKAHIAKTTK